MDPPKIVNETKLMIEGYVYMRSKRPTAKNPHTYWECNRYRSKECRARAITIMKDELVVLKGPNISTHEHPPNREEVSAEILKHRIKRHVEEHPEQTIPQILRTELSGVHGAVLAHLPEEDNLKRSMRRARRRNLLKNVDHQ